MFRIGVALQGRNLKLDPKILVFAEQHCPVVDDLIGEQRRDLVQDDKIDEIVFQKMNDFSDQLGLRAIGLGLADPVEMCRIEENGDVNVVFPSRLSPETGTEEVREDDLLFARKKHRQVPLKPLKRHLLASESIHLTTPGLRQREAMNPNPSEKQYIPKSLKSEVIS